MSAPTERVCDLCAAGSYRHLHTFTSPPEGETQFPLDEPYHRELWACDGCGHVVNRHGFDLADLYAGHYVESTYADRTAGTFDRIMGLTADQSDNRQRVARINEFLSGRLPAPRTLLDVGSGLAVFPVAMQEAGWQATAVDPDPVAVEHASTRGIKAEELDYLAASPDGTFDLVTLNKVLEHVQPMTAMLAKTRDNLTERGYVYIELPDAEMAMLEGPAREEFYVEHYCAFSAASLALFAQQAGFRVELLERVYEPSTKYTLRAFLRPAGSR